MPVARQSMISTPNAEALRDLIAETPLVALKSYPGVLLKCEHENPSGSHKDRAYVRMLSSLEGVEAASTLCDFTTGNGGISLAWLARRLSKRAVVFMPDGMTKERSELIRANGAELIITPRHDFIRGAREAAEQYVERHPSSLLINQSDNLANQAAYIDAGGEVVRQCGELGLSPRAFVCGLGTGGAFSGFSFAMAERFNPFSCVAIEVAEAPVIWAKRQGVIVTPKLPSIIGFGAGTVARNTDERLIDDLEVVSIDDVREPLERLKEQDGLSVGPSTAANVWVAAKRAEQLRAPVVTISFDRGDRYS